MDQSSLSPKERRQQRTRHAILDAARRLIREKGMDGLSMRAIANCIDYSPAGLYEYFGGKDEIIQEVCQQGEERLYAYMAQVNPELPPEERLLAIGLAYIRFARERPDYFLLMFTNTASPLTDRQEPDAVPGPDSSFGLLLQVIGTGIEAGLFAPRPNFGQLEMAYAAWVTVHGIAMLETGPFREYPQDMGPIQRATLENFIAGLKHGA